MDKQRCWSLLMAALLMGTSGHISAATGGGLKGLADRADAVYIAEVLMSRGVETQGGLTTTRVTLEVEDPIKGSAAAGERISLVQAGGTVRGHVAHVPGSEPFHNQDKVLLFLRETDSGSFEILDLYKGRFALRPHPESGEAMVIGFSLEDGQLKASSVQPLDDALDALEP